MPVDEPVLIRGIGAEDMRIVARVLGADLARYYARRLHQDGVVLSAWRGGDLLGAIYVSFEPADERKIRRWLPGVPLLYRLFVRHDVRKLGVGTELIRAAEDLLPARGHTRMAVGVDPHNYRAIRLYEGLGYKDWGFGEIATYVESYVDQDVKRSPDRCAVYVGDLRDMRAAGEAAAT